ncbi:MAG: hypothetical protein WAK55_04280, partial [Xanthobacteraceae bacterium]
RGASHHLELAVVAYRHETCVKVIRKSYAMLDSHSRFNGTDIDEWLSDTTTGLLKRAAMNIMRRSPLTTKRSCPRAALWSNDCAKGDGPRL